MTNETTQQSTNTALDTARLGTTDLTITRVGFGSWAVSGSGWSYSWGATDDAESVAAIRHAVDSGVNWIDTAPVYGLGHSEELVGKAVSAYSEADRPYLFTKAGLVWDPENPQAAPIRTMRPAGVRRELEASLRRLGVEQIDLYQVHWPDTGKALSFVPGDAGDGSVSPDHTPLAEYWQLMADLKAEGKVRAIALSNHSAEELAVAESIAHVDAVQPPFSAINRSAAADIAWAKAHDTGVIVYSPMQSGLLTGAFSAERVANLPADDWRRESADFTSGLAANLQVAEALRPIAARHGVSVAEVAIAWTLAWPGVTGAIVGARKAAQVDGWLHAGALRLTEQDRAEVTAAIRVSGAGFGPATATA
ncbi:aldo/keto reductase [Catenulispora sp. NF23]|uniref:Aldo/keto reductase n=1 Tax=Catenulispora pinistramenti TaxID=2705254 RepID=A0ABS5L435_9ACTN|nr:aldo/keto reductase [Catenulispora pinistramenti]MBS2537127.1 aldo/keto reductase [Catenulispora pinistramenti]MBS2553115.1 aldo/keto reductase [Catenulispora pinistramenti]